MIDMRLTQEEARALRMYLATRPERLLKRWGVLFVAQAQRAFREQRFGAIIWPERYPNQTGEKLNVAGAVEDLKTGDRIKKRRFEARPAGRDTGDLLRRITFRVQDGILEVGANLPYATRFHAGGQSSQQITSTIRHNLATAMRRERRSQRRRARQGDDSVRIGPRGGVSTSLDRLGFLFVANTLVTKSPPRPFVGITEETRGDMERVLKRDLREFIRNRNAEGEV